MNIPQRLIPDWLELTSLDFDRRLLCVVRHGEDTEEYDMHPKVHTMSEILVVASVMKDRLVKRAQIAAAVLQKLEEDLDNDIPF